MSATVANKGAEPVDGISWCSLSHLSLQRAQAQLLRQGKHEVHAQQAGQHLSIHKGRGMDFTESRVYQAGDDVRFLDWRVTARTGKLHTKLFAEERERPILFLVDMRASMFFGTRRSFKSVLAAEVASLLAWKSIQEGDKTGGVILTAAGELSLHKPGRSQTAVARFIQSVSEATLFAQGTVAAKGFAQSIPKNDLFIAALQRLGPLLETGAQCVILTDFREQRDLQNVLQLDKQLSILAKQAALLIVVVSDPLEAKLAELPAPLELVQQGKRVRLSGHAQQLFQKDYQQWQSSRKQLLEQLRGHANTRLIELSTAHTVAQRLALLARVVD